MLLVMRQVSAQIAKDRTEDSVGDSLAPAGDLPVIASTGQHSAIGKGALLANSQIDKAAQ